MKYDIKAGVLCPWTIHKDNLKVLMIRRSFWNKEKDRPMTFPGEWAFAGGKYDDSDKDLVETAVREFREELGYKGYIENIEFIRKVSDDFYGKNHYVEFYSANVDPRSYFSYEFGREIVDNMWVKPRDAISYIQSEGFEQEQEYMIKKCGLNKPEYGKYAIDSRQKPEQTLITLEYFVQNEKRYLGENNER
mgnify:CR=1 FL=1|tara:strand:+ start:1002 stop:1574 length:573 start_codon:yes stop_codon:yes gene_type:complete